MDQSDGLTGEEDLIPLSSVITNNVLSGLSYPQIQDKESAGGRPGAVPVVTAHNDDPWAAGLDDRLGVADEARSFARMAVAKAFTPPLAIGLFGDWGSGKSFFMRLVYEHIERLTLNKLPVKGAPEAGSADFHRDVVQVRFNAWHYAETNLWASLVEHLFSELDRWYGLRNQDDPHALLDGLATARGLTLEAAKELVDQRLEQRKASERLREAEKALASARASLKFSGDLYAQAVVSVFTDSQSDPVVRDTKAEFRAAADELGITRLGEEAASFQDVSSSLLGEVTRARLLFDGFKFQLQSPYFVGLFALIVLASPVVAAAAVKFIPLLSGLHAGVSTLALGLAGVTGLAAKVLATVRCSLDKLKKSKKRLDEFVEQKLKSQVEQVREEEANLGNISAEVEAAKARLQMTSAKLAQATQDFQQGTGAGRLKKFIRERADGRYAQHLGLIATIRRDFEQLAFNIAHLEGNSFSANTGEGLDISVPAVLAAELAFNKKLEDFLSLYQDELEEDELLKLKRPSFSSSQEEREKSFKRIVIYIDDLDRCPPEKVVDVLQAVHLLLTFPIFVVMVAVDVRWVSNALLKHYPGMISDGPKTVGDMASASDYMEKIFQIPYWMRPMGGDISQNFLVDRLLKIDPSLAHLFSVSDDPQELSGETVEKVTTTLAMSEPESILMRSLVPHIGGSPRRTLRFLNVYRLIKVSLDRQQLEVLSNGGYRALLTQLALSTGSPRIFAKLLRTLDGAVSYSTLHLMYEAVFYSEDLDALDVGRARKILDHYHDEVDSSEMQVAMLQLKEYAAIARRYSFVG
ncbi:P-loop NTPase fold protein [Pseudomonas asplenii]|uniref:P-loop NTPase fold protein n=1 Tax=Pseudomonas asplenii TaxID=53407 RepID=UPI0018DED5F0|nr:P-loop NTPase fold protein [Pseudomonas fuscovaginae]